MKKTFLLFAACILTSGLFAQELVVYNGEDVDFEWEQFVFASETVDNQWKTGINSTEKCVQIARPKNTTEIWGGAIYHSLNVPNISDYGFITMMVKKDVAGKSRFELQSAGEVQKYMTAEINYTDAGNWERLLFNLEANTLNGEAMTTALVSIHMEDTENDPNFMDQYMYFDQIVLYPKLSNPNYKDAVPGSMMWTPFLVDAVEVANPDKTGNTSDKCMKITRTKDAEMWSGMRAPRLNVTGIETGEKITMMVKKDVAGPVMIELQTKDESAKMQLTADYTNIGQWQEIEFTVANDDLKDKELGIILLGVHYVDTKTDDTYTTQDMYIDEVKFASYPDPTDPTPPLPEPPTSTEKVEFDATQIVSSTVYTITGQFIKTFQQDEDINSSSLPKGIYILRQTDIKGNIKSIKVAN